MAFKNGSSVLEHLASRIFCGRGFYNLLWLKSDNSLARRGLFALDTGIQQGEPIRLALFALSDDDAARGVPSEFNVWYSEDATLGDSPERVHDNLVVFLETLSAIGLELIQLLILKLMPY